MKLELDPLQQARNDGDTASRLRAVLEEARAEHELATIAHAVRPSEETLDLSVAASSAVDHALSSLAYFVAGRTYHGEVSSATEENPLHELCRLARMRVHQQVKAITEAGQ
jgi:hypothetical protein